MPDPGALPSGFYDRLITRSLRAALGRVGPRQPVVEAPVEAEALRRRLLDALQREIAAQFDAEGASLADADCVALFNALVGLGASGGPVDPLDHPVARLQGLFEPGVEATFPTTGLVHGALFAAGKGTPSLLSELRAELSHVDRVDLLISFIKWEGYRRIEDVLRAATAVGADGVPRTRLRILTTAYCGFTDARAVLALAELPGVEVRISLDGERTRLHAKAWIFHRKTGFGAAYVGSANLTGAALAGGLEWTVKFTQAGDPWMFERAEAHFETHWNDAEFLPFDPRDPEHLRRLEGALRRARGRSSGSGDPADDDPNEAALTWFGIEPRAFQQEMLDRLAAERRQGRTRNLLVAATGTGKTVVAAFDYRRTCEAAGGRPRLLFVAHRQEILRQARAVYRNVLRDSSFGTLATGDTSPASYDHAFVTVQTLNARDLIARLGPSYWHTVVVDECHRAAAQSYDDLLRALTPRILLGLTATPERSDGRNITTFFDMRPDGAPAAELRLWQALDQELLTPFEYYGCEDDTDLRDVPWDRQGERQALDHLLGSNTARAATALNAFRGKVAEPRRARALGFCVSVAHAEFMADYFTRHGVPALSVSGDTPTEARRAVPTRLERREVNVVFTCDLYNEGIDIPSVDTILFLRPTQSPIVFQQQLGRGLRRADQKSSCVVIDLVGRHRETFRFDRLLQTMTGLPRARLIPQVEHGFAELPPGCHIHLDRVARERVLASLRHLSSQRWRSLVADVASYRAHAATAALRLPAFLRETQTELDACYPDRGVEATGWTALLRDAGIVAGAASDDERRTARRLHALLHHDDPSLLTSLQAAAESDAPYGALPPREARALDVVAAGWFPHHGDVCHGDAFLRRIRASAPLRQEIVDLAAVLRDRSDLAPSDPGGDPVLHRWGLTLHARYARAEILVACGWNRPDQRRNVQAGVLALDRQRVELLFVTLDKRVGFSESTAYHDYAISPTRFHWQSQNSAGPDTPAGRRYLAGGTDGWTFQLFTRETQDDDFRALGAVTLESATGARPLSITWRMAYPLPAELFRRYSVLRSA